MNCKFKFSFIMLLGLFVCSVSGRWIVWTSGPFGITLQNNRLELHADSSCIAEICSFQFNYIEPESLFVESSKSDTLILGLVFSGTDGFHDDFPKQLSMTLSRSGRTLHFHAGHPAFSHITIQLKDQNEQYFGLIEKCYPHNSKNPDLRGNVVDVEVYGNGSEDYAENYASAYSAFYMSSLGYGSFFDTFARGRYHLAINGMTEIDHQTHTLDWYIFYGPDGDSIHREYFRVIGRPKPVPAWACGPIFWRDQNNRGKDEILEDIQKFTELEIPLTACWVDRPYSHGANAWSEMDFSESFQDPGEWIKTINTEYGLEFMTWVGPMTFTDRDFPGLLPGHPGYMDLTMPDALEEFWKRLNQFQYTAGVRGHKMDRADESFPINAKWHDPVSETESRNRYVYLYSRVIHEFLSKAHGTNQFNFARAAFHRCQPNLSAIWGGDSRSNWQGMAGSQANSIRCGFMGFPVWGQDTGGYLGPGRIDETLYSRWLEWGAWNGMFEVKIDGSGGSGEDRPPWKYSKNLQHLFRNLCTMRMDLIPYIYSCANTSYKDGVLMKPLALKYLQDRDAAAAWDEYLFGSAFLIAPVFSEENRRTIYFPKGVWYAMDNPDERIMGPDKQVRDVPLATIPVFIRGNSIYVTGSVIQGNAKKWMKKSREKEGITVHLFPGESGEQAAFTYVDALDSDHEKDMLLRNESGKIIFVSDALINLKTIEIRCAAKPGRILLNGKPVSSRYDSRHRTVFVQVKSNQPVSLEMGECLDEG